jgi:hypothetical protein
LDRVDLFQVFEALKLKAERATPFQWRKLREVCLISKSSERKRELKEADGIGIELIADGIKTGSIRVLIIFEKYLLFFSL